MKENHILLIQFGWWEITGGGSSSDDLSLTESSDSIKHGQRHGGADISKRNPKYVNYNDKGDKDDDVLGFCCGSVR